MPCSSSSTRGPWDIGSGSREQHVLSTLSFSRALESQVSGTPVGKTPTTKIHFWENSWLHAGNQSEGGGLLFSKIISSGLYLAGYLLSGVMAKLNWYPETVNSCNQALLSPCRKNGSKCRGPWVQPSCSGELCGYLIICKADGFCIAAFGYDTVKIY